MPGLKKLLASYMKGIGLKECRINFFYARVKPDYGRIDRGSCGCLTVDAGLEGISQAIGKVCLLLQAGKMIDSGGIVIRLEALLPSMESSGRRIVREGGRGPSTSHCKRWKTQGC